MGYHEYRFFVTRETIRQWFTHALFSISFIDQGLFWEHLFLGIWIIILFVILLGGLCRLCVVRGCKEDVESANKELQTCVKEFAQLETAEIFVSDVSKIFSICLLFWMFSIISMLLKIVLEVFKIYFKIREIKTILGSPETFGAEILHHWIQNFPSCF